MLCGKRGASYTLMERIHPSPTRAFGLLLLSVLLPVAGFAQTQVTTSPPDGTVWNAAGSPYRVMSSLTLTGSLVIENGVTVEFSPGTGITVRDNGSLEADGVTFTSTGATNRAAWSGLFVGQENTATVQPRITLRNSTVRYADTGVGTLGGSWTGSAYFRTRASIVLEGTTISTVNRGINVLQGRSRLALHNVSISGADLPMAFHGGGYVTFTGLNTFSANTNAYVRLQFGTLSDSLVVVGAPNVPFVPDGSLTVSPSGVMEIGAGNVFKFRNQAELIVEGVIKAQALPAESLVFTSFADDNAIGDTNGDGTNSGPSRGSWYGIRVVGQDLDAQRVMEGVTVRWAGTNGGWQGYRGGITLENTSMPIANSTFSNNVFGVVLHGPSNPALTGNTFATSAVVPVAMTIAADPALNNNVFSSSDNQYDAIGILPGTISGTSTLRRRGFEGVDNVTYVVLGDVVVDTGAELTIEAGIVFKTPSNSPQIRVKGRLNAIGTAEMPIVFTSISDDNVGNPRDTNRNGNATTPSPGDWAGLMFQAGSSATVLDHVQIRYGISTDRTYDGDRMVQTAAISLFETSLTLRNSILSNGAHGMVMYRSSRPVVANNQFVGLTGAPVILSMSADPTFSGNTLLNVNRQALGILPETVQANGFLRSRTFAGFENITYTLEGIVTIASGTTVEVEPGVVIKFGPANQWMEASEIGIRVEGGFRAVGNAMHGPIVFTSILDDTVGNPADTNGDGNASQPTNGHWSGIVYRASTDDAASRLEEVQIRYAWHGIVQQSANVPLQNVRISDARYWGLVFEGDATGTVDEVDIVRTGSAPIALAITTAPEFGTVRFTSTGYNGIALLEGARIDYWSSFNPYNRLLVTSNTIGAHARLSQRDVAGFSNIPYLLLDGTLSVGEEALLTIDPGIILKVTTGGISVNGALQTLGTASEPVIITFTRDDVHGGDTNNDGNTTLPQPFWEGIRFNASSLATQNRMEHTRVLYTNGDQAIRVVNSTVELESISVQNASKNGIEFSNATGMLRNSTIELISGYGVSIRGVSAPELRGNQFTNIGRSPIIMSMFAEPTFADNRMENIGIRGITIYGENWTGIRTVPQRDFAGFTNITYLIPQEQEVTLMGDAEITVPAGTVFKGECNPWGNCARITIDGALITQGTEEAPVVFTHLADDRYGNPSDTQNNSQQPYDLLRETWLTFNSGSNDARNRIEGAILSGREYGISMVSAAPVITQSHFDNLTYGIRLNGVSTPAVTHNTFEDLSRTPILTSMVSWPSDTEGNSIVGSTFSAIGILSETLVQDATLRYRTFAGKEGIVYYFPGNYAVGTNAVLTVEPGVIAKFERDASLTLQRGMVAQGTPDSLIVFTSIRDDFYGGDTNKDEGESLISTAPNWDSWIGIRFASTALPARSVMEHAVVRFAREYGVDVQGSSPSITNSALTLNAVGVRVTGAGNPILRQNVYQGNRTFAIENRDKTFTVDATESWWGNDSGPRHALNPEGTGDIVTDGVNYENFVGMGSIQPILGDVSRNGAIQAWDASLVLRHLVELITLSSRQLDVADVSGDGSVSAMDASYVLQYVTQLITHFPAEVRAKTLPEPDLTALRLFFGAPEAMEGNLYRTPVRVEGVSGIHAFTMALRVPNTAELHEGEALDQASVLLNRNDDRGLYAMAHPTGITPTGPLFYVVTTGQPAPMEVLKVVVNETPVEGVITHADEALEVPAELTLSPVFPNPVRAQATVRFSVPVPTVVALHVVNALGQHVATLNEGQVSAGWHSLNIDASTWPAGLYTVQIVTPSAHRAQTLVRIP